MITDILKRKKNPQKNQSGCPWMKQKNLQRKKLKKWASQIYSFLTGITRCAKVLKAIIVQVILEMDIELTMHVP